MRHILAPMPHRGKRNEPSFVAHTARSLAELKGVAFEELAAATTRKFLPSFPKGRPPVMTDTIEITILGCGSSGGVPRLGGADGAGNWGVCDPDQSEKPPHAMLGAGAAADREAGTTAVLVDTSPDMREQLLRAQICDAGWRAHHARSCRSAARAWTICARWRITNAAASNVYADARTGEAHLERFSYCFVQPRGQRLSAHRQYVRHREPFAPFEITGAGGAVPVLAFSQRHGRIRSLGFRFGPIAYSADVNAPGRRGIRGA